mmetsp:Transcript_11383/g.27794  ORF Transcript_11383/g.27794 Transcript_11383/m.27794 type:complete len:253 (+) Transcript_11383:2902-3660(+)
MPAGAPPRFFPVGGNTGLARSVFEQYLRSVFSTRSGASSANCLSPKVLFPRPLSSEATSNKLVLLPPFLLAVAAVPPPGEDSWLPAALRTASIPYLRSRLAASRALILFVASGAGNSSRCCAAPATEPAANASNFPSNSPLDTFRYSTLVAAPAVPPWSSGDGSLTFVPRTREFQGTTAAAVDLSPRPRAVVAETFSTTRVVFSGDDALFIFRDDDDVAPPATSWKRNTPSLLKKPLVAWCAFLFSSRSLTT